MKSIPERASSTIGLNRTAVLDTDTEEMLAGEGFDLFLRHGVDAEGAEGGVLDCSDFAQDTGGERCRVDRTLFDEMSNAFARSHRPSNMILSLRPSMENKTGSDGLHRCLMNFLNPAR